MARLNSAESWKKRLFDAVGGDPGKVVFVVGAGLSWDGKVGVWGVSEIVKHIKDTFTIASSDEPAAAAYQDVLGILKAEKGSRAVEKTIRRAVLAAVKQTDARRLAAENEIASNKGLSVCRQLQNDPLAWNLPTGVLALASLLAILNEKAKHNPDWKYPCVLSTNFDGLLEAALAQIGVLFKSEPIAGNVFPQGIQEQLSILHLHGYWLSEPTLHEPEALQARRENLEAALRELLHGAQVFVVGYGGWNDIIFSTATKVLDQQQSSSLLDVMWAFYEPETKVRENDANPKSPCGHVIANLKSSTALTHTTFYCGVDVHRDLPEVVGRFGKSIAVTISTTASSNGPPSMPTVVQLIKTVVAKTPDDHRTRVAELNEAADTGKPISLVTVVAECCKVIEAGTMRAAEKEAFKVAAWDLIAFKSSELVAQLGKAVPVEKIATNKGEILQVPVKSRCLIALLVAKNPNPRDVLVHDQRGARGRYELGKTFQPGEFEDGPAESDRMFDFETLLWKELMPSQPAYRLGCSDSTCARETCARDCDRMVLFQRLEADAEKGQQHHFVIPPGAGSAWKKTAAMAKQIVFVEPGVGTTAGIDEGKLALLISDFLKLSSTKEIR